MPEPTEPGGNATHERHAWRARFVSRLNRFRNLLTSKWWIPMITVVVGLGVEGALWRLEKPMFVSMGRMIMGIRIAVTEASVYSEELSNFMWTQQALMQSSTVVKRAHDRVAAAKPDLPSDVTLKVVIIPKTTIFHLQATGEDPEYTQAFLQALMEEFVLYKNEMRAKTSGQTILGLTEEVIRLEKEVNLAEAELAAFRTTNSVVLSQEQGNSAANYLAALNQRLAALKSEYELLNLLSLDQNLERRQQSPDALPLTAPGDATDKGAAAAGDRADTEYFKAKQQVLLLKAEQKELAQDLRPKHPKMIALTEDIARRERLLAIFRQQSAEQMESKKSSLALQTQNLERDVKEWDAKTLEISRKMAEDQRLKANAQRLQTLYERLSSTMRTVETSAPINSESVTISENSKQMGPTKPRLAHKLLVGALAGLAVGLLLLLILDRLDDRMNSFTELQDMFDEPVLGQIPREKSGKESQGATLMIGSEDMRHAFVEAYRNLRSSLLYIAESGTRPRTVIITSSVPGEGKSLTSANLAITLANSGSRVLLVDGDLRKGVLHDLFAAPPEPGLTEVLSQGLTAEQTIQATKVANLSLLPRGAITHRSSELFVHPAAEKFLKDTSAQYDYVLIDTAPVMAADDVTSLAPNMDGTIFVVRADYTSSRLARAALDLLYQRQVKVIGLVFNAVRPTTLDYYYYKYQEYYAAYPTAASAKRAKV